MPDPAPVGLTEDEQAWLDDFRLYCPVTPGSVFAAHREFADACNKLVAIINRLSAAPVDDREREALRRIADGLCTTTGTPVTYPCVNQRCYVCIALSALAAVPVSPSVDLEGG